MEKLDFAIQVLVLGFLVVVVTLFALYGILLIFSRIFHNSNHGTAALNLTDGKDYAGIEDEESKRRTAAAILAAVYKYIEDENIYSKTGRLKVSIAVPGTQSGNSWRIIGRKNSLENSIELENIRRKKNFENI